MPIFTRIYVNPLKEDKYRVIIDTDTDHYFQQQWSAASISYANDVLTVKAPPSTLFTPAKFNV